MGDTCLVCVVGPHCLCVGPDCLFRLRWVKLRGSEATSKSKELFKQANALQSTLALGAVTGKAAEEMEVRRRGGGRAAACPCMPYAAAGSGHSHE